MRYATSSFSGRPICFTQRPRKAFFLRDDAEIPVLNLICGFNFRNAPWSWLDIVSRGAPRPGDTCMARGQAGFPAPKPVPDGCMGGWAIAQTRAGGGKMGIIGSPRLTMGARALARHPGLGLAGPVRAFAAFPCVRSDNTAPRGRPRAGIGYTELPAPCGSCHVVTRRPCSLGAVYTASCGAPHPCAPISTSHHHHPPPPRGAYTCPLRPRPAPHSIDFIFPCLLQTASLPGRHGAPPSPLPVSNCSLLGVNWQPPGGARA